MKTKIAISFFALSLMGTVASAASIERAGGAKIVGESSWVPAITYISDDGERIKITTENHTVGRALEVGDSFDQLVIAPHGAFSISNPSSVAEFVKAEFGAGYVDVIRNNGQDDKSHW